MSRANKFKNWNPFQKPQPGSSPAAEVTPNERAQVEQLIANGKAGHALDVAKEVHKRVRNAASEELLVAAYTARILSLAERGLDVEANALLALVRERHVSSHDRLREVAAILKARTGGIEGLLELLADPALTAEKRTGIENRIRGAADDPARIARCEALPPEHALRVAAAAVVRVLEAVTSGPVTADALALPEISRTSPLAPWKMLLRAIQVFYAHQDELCEKYLAAVEPAAAPARLVPALRAMIGQRQALTPAAGALVKQADGGLTALRTTLATLDQALDKENRTLALQEIGKAVTLCQEFYPGLLERLKQHISIRALGAGVRADRVAAAMGGPSLKNAYFWRLLARAEEETPHEPRAIPTACSYWEEFRRHAIREKWFPARGPEVAALYLHMADLWKRIPDEEIAYIMHGFAAKFPGNREYYAGQPPEIRSLMLAPGPQDYYYLSANSLCERACDADPCAENFQRWLKLAGDVSAHADRIAEAWAAALPKDIPPVLHLMQSAEKRNALKMAFGYMEQAERLDGLNPAVRNARLRLLISLAIRHLQQKKMHLAEPELRQIEGLPQAQQGDRPALSAALRWVYGTLRGKAAEADSARAAVVRVLGSDAAAQILLQSVAEACKLKGNAPDPVSPSGPLAAALGRACALGEDTGVKVRIPHLVSDQLMRELEGGDGAADAAGLRALGEAALRERSVLLAFAVSTAGLALAQDGWAEFLFLRARSLPDWAEERAGACAAAASELARRQRHPDLLRRIGEWREEEMDWLDRDDAHVAMSTQQVDELVRAEKKQPDFPPMPAVMPWDMEDEDVGCNCPSCRAQREGMPAELERMMEDMGPEAVMKALDELARELGAGKQKRRRSRPAFGNDEFPF
jgi:hypothetical protein